jgi:hypothetical protein
MMGVARAVQLAVAVVVVVVAPRLRAARLEQRLVALVWTV